MCSKNQEVDPLFAQFITKVFLIQRIFRVLRNSLFRKEIAKLIKLEFDQNAQKTQLQLQHWEAELERLLQWKPKEKRGPTPHKMTKEQLHKEMLADIPDLFDL